MSRPVLISIALISALIPPLDAAGAKPKPNGRARKAPAVSTKPISAEPVFTRSADGMITPLAVKMRSMTPAEADANAIWSVRAALNIAALQCQYSSYLATARNYNDVLRQHADELDRARTTMIAHFKRYDGTQAQNSFDRYTTQTYNSFSTLDAQTAFCEAAAQSGRTVLTVRKGELGSRASDLRDALRAALTPGSAHALLIPVEMTPEPLPVF